MPQPARDGEPAPARLNPFMLLVVPTAAATDESGRGCAELTRTRLPNATVTAAESVPTGQYTAPNGQTVTVPAFCRVHGVAKPVPNSTIGFAVWLPQQGWNRRLVMFGNGGYSSAIDFTSMGQALSAGYVTVGTDTGHSGDDPDVFVRGAAATKYVNDDPAQGVALTRQLRPYPERATCG